MYYNVRIKDTIADFTKRLFYSLFDRPIEQEKELVILKKIFIEIANKLSIEKGEQNWNHLVAQMPIVQKKLNLDALAALKNDPASNSLEEIYLAYPGFCAIAIHRLSHELYLQKMPILPRMMSEYAHSLTGADIHPGATIGESFFIDHATGIVIGETSIIKNNVKIYQGVTLGGIQVKKSLAATKRHPTIENGVTIYANATILGGKVVIGENSIIGANVSITKSLEAESFAVYQSENKITKRRK